MVIIGFVPFAIPLNIPFIHTHMYILDFSSGQVKTIVWFSHHMSQNLYHLFMLYLWERHDFTFFWILSFHRKILPSPDCEKVQPLSSSMSFWDFVTQISSLETSSRALLYISCLKQKTVETFPLLLFDAIFCIVGFNHSKLQVYVSKVLVCFTNFTLRSWYKFGDWGGGGQGERKCQETKQKRCLTCLTPVGAVQVRKGSWSHLMAESDAELVSPVELLVCSASEEERQGRRFSF